MPSLGVPELLIVLAVVMLLFGSTRLPKLARSLGEAAKEFRSGQKDGADDTSGDKADKANKADKAD
jgi:sec-independent protein translocase protein TatA